MNTDLFKYAGNLYWYHHEGQLDGSERWQGGLTDPVGVGGWEQYLNVFAAEDGIIYAISSDGNLYWYKHLGWQNGTPQWTERKLVGKGGWQLYKSVFAGSEGVIYGIDVDGNLYWYHHLGWQDGSEQWSDRKLVGDGGWQYYLSVFSAGSGIIYGVGADGNLYWYRHEGWQTGSKEWTSRKQVGTGGWQDYVSVAASDQKIIYAVGADGNLYWYRHDGQQDGTSHWTERTLVGVGGWLGFKCVCVAPGGIIYGVGMDRQSWMSPFRNKFIHELIIPGAHDSGTEGFPAISPSRTQYYTIDEQLRDGVRFLDMRLAYNSVEDNFHVVHGIDVASNLNFDTVVKWCADFLAAHSSETILMSIKQEGLLPGSDEAFARELSNWNATHVKNGDWKSDLWFTTNEMPRVADAKGKIVLLRRYTVPVSVANSPLFLVDWIFPILIPNPFIWEHSRLRM